jgi:hypothetical protein
MLDPKQFLDATYNEANSTELVTVDEGEYQAIAGEVDMTEWTGKKDPSKSGFKLTIPWEIDDQAMRAKTGRERIIIRQDIMLDMSPQGMLDFGKGKNVQLGRLREALGLNQPGKPFSFRQIPGQAAKVKVSIRDYEGRQFEEVKSVAKLGS